MYRPVEVSEHIDARQILALATDQFHEYLEMYGDYSPNGILKTTCEVANSIGIYERTWKTACHADALGPLRTIICVILIHRNMSLPSNAEHYPKNPAACLGGMIRASKNNKLNLVRLIAASRRQTEDVVGAASHTTSLLKGGSHG